MMAKTYKLNLSDYPVPGIELPKGTRGKKNQEVPKYTVRPRLRDLLLHQGLQLTGKQIYDRLPLVTKIVESKEDEIELTKEELAIVRQPFEILHGFDSRDALLIQRIFDIEVELEEVMKDKE